MFDLELTRTIFLTGAFNKYQAEWVVAQLYSLDKSEGDINLIINSQGGYVTDLFAITDTMKLLKNKVNTICLGEASSCGSAAFVSGTGKRYITENSRLMFHNLSSGFFGNFESLQEAVDQIKEIEERLTKMISAKIGMTEKEYREKVYKKDVFFYGDKAVEKGMADEVLTNEQYQKLKLSECSFDAESISDDLKTINILNAGITKGTKYGDLNITEKQLVECVENFNNNVVGRDISIDMTHLNDDGEKPAGAWIKKLWVEGKKLMASVEYTPKAMEMIANKEYKYISVEFAPIFVNHEGRDLCNVLIGATLTNRPVIKGLDPLKLSEKLIKEKQRKEKVMTKEEMMAKLKSENGIDVAKLQKDHKDLSAKDIKQSNELANLKSKAILEAKEKTFTALLEAGKVAVAQKESLFKTFETAEKMDTIFKYAPIAVKMKADGDGGADDDASPEETKAIADLVATGEYTEAEAKVAWGQLQEEKSRKE